MWAHFFGIGILDPVDEPGENNPPSHPELLDELGQAFADGKFDNRAADPRHHPRRKAYQLTSSMSHPTQADPRRFARMNVKGLTPAQLFDTLVAATGYRETGVHGTTSSPSTPAGQPAQRVPRPLRLQREADRDAARTILQALMLMNGQFIGDQTSLEKSEILGRDRGRAAAGTPSSKVERSS